MFRLEFCDWSKSTMYTTLTVYLKEQWSVSLVGCPVFHTLGCRCEQTQGGAGFSLLGSTTSSLSNLEGTHNHNKNTITLHTQTNAFLLKKNILLFDKIVQIANTYTHTIQCTYD